MESVSGCELPLGEGLKMLTVPSKRRLDERKASRPTEPGAGLMVHLQRPSEWDVSNGSFFFFFKSVAEV